MNASQVFRRRLSSKREKKAVQRIPHGRKAQLSVFTRPADPKLASQIEPIEGDIKDRGNGDYEIIYISKTAGPVEVVVTGNSEEAVYDSTCYAATAACSNVPR